MVNDAEHGERPGQWKAFSYTDELWADAQKTAHPDYAEEIGAVRNIVAANAGGEGVLDYLSVARDLRRTMDLVILDLVAEARSEGQTWAEVGRVLSVGRTAAQKRFGPKLADRIRALGLELELAVQENQRFIEQHWLAEDDEHEEQYVIWEERLEQNPSSGAT